MSTAWIILVIFYTWPKKLRNTRLRISQEEVWSYEPSTVILFPVWFWTDELQREGREREGWNWNHLPTSRRRLQIRVPTSQVVKRNTSKQKDKIGRDSGRWAQYRKLVIRGVPRKNTTHVNHLIVAHYWERRGGGGDTSRSQQNCA